MNGLFGCLTPPSLCCLTCFVSCVTFGKTHYRLAKNGDVTGYEPLIASCLLFCFAGYFGGPWILNAVQLQEIREKHNLEGSRAEDLFKSYYCLCCSLMQAERESQDKATVVSRQYAPETMAMAQQPAPEKEKFQGPGQQVRAHGGLQNGSQVEPLIEHHIGAKA